MSADQIAAMSPAISEVFSGGNDLCVTFAIAGQPASWVQFTNGAVNAAYPHAAEPGAILATLHPVILEGWKAGQFLTVRMPSADAHGAATWIDKYFEKVLAAGASYAIDVKVQKL